MPNLFRVALVVAAGAVGAGAALGVGLLVGNDTVAAPVVQALLVACSAGWMRRVAPRVWPAVGRWRPAAVAGPVLLASLPGPAPVVAGATALAVLRVHGGRPAAAALVASGPFAVSIAVPHTLDGWRGVTCSGVAVVVAATAAYLVTALPPGPSAVRSRPRTPPRWPHLLATAAVVAVAVTAAALLGGWLFPAHPAWPVLTVFIVLGGGAELRTATAEAARRLGGAVLGATAATLLQLGLHPAPVVCLALAAVAVLLGYTLRPSGYLWWSAGMTAGLTLASATPSWDFAIGRTTALLAGGLIAVTAALLFGTLTHRRPRRNDERTRA